MMKIEPEQSAMYDKSIRLKEDESRLKRFSGKIKAHFTILLPCLSTSQIDENKDLVKPDP